VPTQYRYELVIMVAEDKKPAFQTKLLNYLATAKASGEIVSAKGTVQPTEVPEVIEIT